MAHLFKSKLTVASFLFFLGALLFFLGAQGNNQKFSAKPLAQVTPSQKALSSDQGISSADTPADSFEEAEVVRVVDGDTIEIAGGKTVRYIGIDTPETVDPRRPVGCFGKEASDKNKELVEGRQVKLVKDVSETDKYGRLLRYVYVGDTFVNDFLVRNGFAKSSSYPPDIKFQEQFREAENEAREGNKGLWAGCNTSVSEQVPTIVQASSPGNCLIKGNISSSGEKIYHMPGQQYYTKTKIDEGAGERWFCSEEEAISSGWRKSKV
ncbi:hypothetical protein A2617_03910 [Candidatus Daviesbacteria bacterium RIFOXYD1_FULL_41_10]|uniref:TNase-like domain-containing protein n=2 Tax=Candidatus Daviesiibacteriota TaxID=1752718 RepID=A0A1F5N054_9BACT|nr:MAG: Micrococcal nuclease-like protein nuclease [Candidatus Daviesbacteria bacterium GW2011_GWB1_41_5]OGE70962.1 MAG: hypothetical protein A2617_03910 [Candidatus Daviesbacteria bacterium RIFOXYD1_FULL_41_10]